MQTVLMNVRLESVSDCPFRTIPNSFVDAFVLYCILLYVRRAEIPPSDEFKPFVAD